MIQYKLIAIAVVIMLAAISGALVNGWRLNAKFADGKIEYEKQLAERDAAIDRQNAAIRRMTDQYKQSLAMAEKAAKAAAVKAKKREATIREAEKKSSCDEVMGAAWSE